MQAHVGQALGQDLVVQLLWVVGHQDDLVGAHVDGDVLARVALKVPVARHASMMPALHGVDGGWRVTRLQGIVAGRVYESRHCLGNGVIPLRGGIEG